jgi:sortase A
VVAKWGGAAHRSTNGEPFARLDRLRPGDVVVAETRRSWFVYEVDRTRIVSPTATWVVTPTRRRDGADPTRRLLTLTTCHPRWSSTQRLVVFGHLEEQRPKSDGPPAVLAAGD